MTRFFLLLLVSGLCLAGETLAGDFASFTGSWIDSASNASAFSLDLVQTGNRLRGYHTSIARHGNRIDAVLPGEGPPSIEGAVTGAVANVRFRSGYGDQGGGEAMLTLRGRKLEWKITKSSGAHYLPLSSVLHLEKKRRTDPFHADPAK